MHPSGQAGLVTVVMLRGAQKVVPTRICRNKEEEK